MTYDLYKLNNEVAKKNGTLSEEDALNTTTKLCEILNTTNIDRIPADLQITTHILQTITQHNKQPELLPNVLKIANNLMSSSAGIIMASNKIGTTKILIKTVEEYLDNITPTIMPTTDNCSKLRNGVIVKSEDQITVFYINALCTNISGVAIYQKSVQPTVRMMYDALTKSYYRYLYMNQSLDELIQESNIEAAVHLPENLWKSNSKLGTVKISLYHRNEIFMDEHASVQPNSLVLKVTVPEYKELPENVSLIFRDHHPQADKENKTSTARHQCGQWNYKAWNYDNEGDTTTIANNKNLILCKTRSTVSFGALVGLSQFTASNNLFVLRTLMEYTMDIISIVGCCLSLFGLLCIWITAICYKKWRMQASNKLLLNISVVLTLLMAYFLFINIPDTRTSMINPATPQYCIAEGAFLQYIILVLFFWMFFLAILQYKRYVVVVGVDDVQYYFAQITIAAWCLPIVPTALVLYFDSTAYIPAPPPPGNDDYGINYPICYLKGLSLYLSLLLPIAIISIANLVVFVCILVSVNNSLNRKLTKRDRNMIYVQLRLSILLFFLLGISWVFGLLAHLDQSGVLAFYSVSQQRYRVSCCSYILW
ncbi:adhesion G-protein coupled receptor G6-like [Musca autumnalis]|uniref:adhesion G-protein coupled receptor G6-like n=1 Tax=Musca autumnalis TaxID=221902 RepID=UPI003CEB38EA